MRTDQGENNQGGTKKFLYSGPQPKDVQEDRWNFSSNNNSNRKPPSDFDFDEVWSIKKNVALGKPAGQIHQDSLDLNMKKTFYSRYGNLKEDGKTPADTAPAGRSWNSQQKPRFSYGSSGLDPSGGRLSHGSNHSDDSAAKMKFGQPKGSPMGSRYF